MSETLEAQHENSTEEQQAVKATPWVRLRHARESMDLTPVDVANELKLNLRLVKALEEGDLKKLPQPVFIAGYLRAYAKLVNLPADEIVHGYTDQASGLIAYTKKKAEEDVPDRFRQLDNVLPKGFSIAHDRTQQNSRLIRYAAIALFGLLIILLTWQFSNMFSGGSAELDQLTSTDIEVDAMLVQPVETQPQTASAVAPDTGTPPAAKPVETITVELPIKGQTKNIATAPIDPKDLSVISIRFSEDSWVDIRDATGKHLVRSLGVAGNERTVKGVAPFEVLVGFAPGVSIIYNGEPFDISPYQRDKIARFILGTQPGTSTTGTTTAE